MIWRLMLAMAFVSGLAFVSPAQAQQSSQPKASLGILVDQAAEGAQGVVVRSVSKSGAAGQAGIQKGDIITKVGNHTVENYSQLEHLLAQHKPGQKVPVTVTRHGEEKTMAVTLGE